MVPAEAARLLRAHAGFDVERIHEIESEVKHDVIAFTTAVAETMAARRARRSVALVSLRADVQRRGGYGAGAAAAAGVGDSARRSEQLREVLKRRALEFQHTVQIGRTHGVHAEPITFGLKLAIWYEEAGRNLDAAARGRRRTCGSARRRARWARSAHIGPETEELICARLDLKPAAVASQVIQRDRHADFVSRAGAG